MKKESKQIIMFFALTVIITWFLWTGSVISSYGFEVPVIWLMVGMAANFTPSIVGLVLSSKEKGWRAVRFDIQSKLKLKGTGKAYLNVLVVFGLTSFIAFQLVKDQVVDAPLLKQPLMIPLVFIQILVIGGALGEEFGWRYYALPRLENLFSPLIATLMLGLVWSTWHLPLFFMEGTVQSQLPLWQFVLQNTLIAYIYTFFYHKHKGNMVLIIGIHAIGNTASAIFPYWQTNMGRWYNFIMLLIVVLIMLMTDKKWLSGFKQAK